MSNSKPYLNRFSYIRPSPSTHRPSSDGAPHGEESQPSIVKKKLGAIVNYIRSKSGVTFLDIAEHFTIPPSRHPETKRQLRRAEKEGRISIQKISREMRDHIVAINLYLPYKGNGAAAPLLNNLDVRTR